MSSHFSNLDCSDILREPNNQRLALLDRGGLAQVTSHPGGSTTQFALTCLSSYLEKSEPAPPLSLWISDEGSLYPASLRENGKVLLSRLLLVQASSSQDVWRVALESVQTGLFLWVFLRPSKSCPVSMIRKLQLCSEKMRTRVLILTKHKLPHWTLKAHFQVLSGGSTPCEFSISKVQNH